MNQTDRPAPPEYYEDEINLSDYLLVLLRRKKLIMAIVFLAIVASVAISLHLPNMYTATARILPPPESSSSLSSYLSQVGGALGGMAGGILGGESGAEIYVGILESRTVADALIRDFNLKERYEQEYMDNVYRVLAGRTKIQVSRKTQILSVSVEDRDPERAAEMANTYVDALDQINRKVNITEGYRKRIFLEERIDKVKKDLATAEATLKEFQEKYKLIAIEEQARAAIEGAARLKAEIIASQTQLEVLKQFGTEKQNEAIMLKSKINELNKQLARIENGNLEKEILGNNRENKKSPNFYIPFKEMPELGMQLARLIREAKIQEEVFELLVSQYELAKIEEAKDVNIIQVLDRAVPPDRKSSPKRSLIVILSTVVSFFLAVFLAFFVEYVARLKTEDPDRYRELGQALKFRKPK